MIVCLCVWVLSNRCPTARYQVFLFFRRNHPSSLLSCHTSAPLISTSSTNSGSQSLVLGKLACSLRGSKEFSHTDCFCLCVQSYRTLPRGPRGLPAAQCIVLPLTPVEFLPHLVSTFPQRSLPCLYYMVVLVVVVRSSSFFSPTTHDASSPRILVLLLWPAIKAQCPPIWVVLLFGPWLYGRAKGTGPDRDQTRRLALESRVSAPSAFFGHTEKLVHVIASEREPSSAPCCFG